MPPPFFGTKIIDTIGLDDIVPFIDEEQLFAARWQFRKGADAAAWEVMRREKAIPAFERTLALCRLKNAIVPKIIIGFFRCTAQGSALLVENEGHVFRFDFPRERTAPNRSLADFFSEGFVSIQLATVGDGAAKEGARLFKEGAYGDAFFLKGFAAEAAEATAALGHRLIRHDLGVDDGVGCRFSPGYPVCPSLFDQRKIAALLKFARVGVTLTRTCHLIPEYSTTAFVSVDPQATIFRP